MRLWPSRANHPYKEAVFIKEPVSSSGPRAIAVASGKGGVGKTSLTVNLALCLASMNRKVTVFDADLGLANAEVLLGILPPYSLHEVLYGNKTIEEITVRGPLGIKVISGGSGFLELANLDRTRRQNLFRMLNQFGDRDEIILIDTGAGINKNVLGFVAAAGEVIIVVTPEPTSLTDAYALIKILANFKVNSQIHLVVNRAADRREAVLTLERISTAAGRFLDMRLNSLGWIPEDRLVSHSIKNQQPFFLGSPNSPLARSITDIAHNLVEERRPVLEGGFWKRLIGLFG
ncbi:MAG TPA: MinD/ParA family protein [Bacillota bacterium]|nr:MinD/ParA family protein [Bacillota bacterium]